MKSKEFHRWIMKQKSKWKYEKAEGSHYIYVHEDGRRYPVPYHGSKEIGEGLRKGLLTTWDDKLSGVNIIIYCQY